MSLKIPGKIPSQKKDSPYYYYLHDSNGEIHYGKTLEEHNANKRRYLQ
jgi:cell division protein YceG involved in septum cleavage